MKPADSSTEQHQAGKSNALRRHWKLFAIAGAFLIVAIGLGVGLGVGLTQRGGHDDSDQDNDNNSGSNSDPDSDNRNRTSTWQPSVNATWQIVLQGAIKLTNGSASPDVAIWDLDLFDNDAETFKALQGHGKKVICYFSAGSYENFRPDKGRFNESDLGKPLDGWPNERWLDLNSDNVRSIMRDRIKLASSKGCDAIDPDNVDGYQNDNGLNLTVQDSINYLQFLHTEASSYHMSIGLKNAGDIIPKVLDFINFSVNEQCAEFSECETFAPFIKAGKPVFHIEYPKGAPAIDAARAADLCSHQGIGAGSGNFSTVLKKMELDGFVQYCDGKRYTTALDS
ncbi:glycoside hydrolase superfamily [Trichoderma sp. SZMC 28012]